MTEVTEDDQPKPWLLNKTNQNYYDMKAIVNQIVFNPQLMALYENLNLRGYASSGYYFWKMSRSDIENIKLLCDMSKAQKERHDKSLVKYESCKELQQVTFTVMFLLLCEGRGDIDTNLGKYVDNFTKIVDYLHEAVSLNKPIDYTRISVSQGI